MKATRLAAIACAAVACFAAGARADSLVDEAGQFGPQPDSAIRAFPFKFPEGTTQAVLNTDVSLSHGRVTIRVLDSRGQTVCDLSTGGKMTITGNAVPSGGQAGTFRVEVVPKEAVGKWSVTVLSRSTWSTLAPLGLSGTGMILVAAAAVALWKWRRRVKWRWFAVGAALWAVGVALKIAWALALNGPILGGLERILPHAAYLAAGSVYIGLLTGVFEIGVTLAAVLIWRRMAADADRAVAVGVGAGAVEAFLLGWSVLGLLVAALAHVPQVEPVLAQMAGGTSAGFLAWLAPVVERVSAILGHTASRALVLASVAGRRWALFAWAFLLMTGIDAVAGYAHLSGLMGGVSVWWIELAVAPFAAASVPIILWCLRRWPGGAGEAPAAP